MKKYTVKQNEDIGHIAAKFGLASWKYLYQINKGKIGDNPDLLKAGTELDIPQMEGSKGEKKIEAKGEDPFHYTGGLVYRYPWVAFSLTLTGTAGAPTSDFDKERDYVIYRETTGETIAKGKLKKAQEVNALVVLTDDIMIGVKDFPVMFNGKANYHPDDARGKTTAGIKSHKEFYDPAGDANGPSDPKNDTDPLGVNSQRNVPKI